MNLSALGPELVLLALGLTLLMVDLVVPAERRRLLGGVAAAVVFALFVYFASRTGASAGGERVVAFDGLFVLDGLAVFAKAIFLLAGAVVLLIAVDDARGLGSGVSEYYVLTLFALTGMLFAASANDFSVMYVALELVTVTFYVLTSYQRARVASLEAGVKYLILGALSSAFLVYGIALCFGAAGTMRFDEIAAKSAALADSRLFQLGMLMIFGGLAFKVALFPFQIWAPDVYDGAPVPTAAFLAIGSKATGVVLLIRLFGSVAPELALKWEPLWMSVAAISVLYGSLCALPQRKLKRLLGYSSIANGGFVMIGLAAMSKAGVAAVLFYLAGYLFTVLVAFQVIHAVIRQTGSDDFSALAGLHRRSPALAAALTLSMVSLAGVPPLAGFFGKFLVLKALVEQGTSAGSWYVLAGVAILGVVISLWYYFGVIRAIYWGDQRADERPLVVSPALALALAAGVLGLLGLGVFPGAVWDAALAAVAGLRL